MFLRKLLIIIFSLFILNSYLYAEDTVKKVFQRKNITVIVKSKKLSSKKFSLEIEIKKEIPEQICVALIENKPSYTINQELKYVFKCKNKICYIPRLFGSLTVEMESKDDFITIAVYKTDLGYPEPTCTTDENKIPQKLYFNYLVIHLNSI